MDVTPSTSIRSLLDAYPTLLPFLVAYDSEFKKLENPVLRATMARVATLAVAAEMANVPADRLVADIQAEIARGESGEAGADDDASRAAQRPAERRRALKAIIADLHDGADVADVKARFNELVRDVSPSEIAQMEQELVAEGLPVEEIQRLCDVHVSVFRDALDAKPAAVPKSDHPAGVFARDNADLTARAVSLKRAFTELGETPDQTLSAGVKQDIAAAVRDLRAASDEHYVMKENQLFPVLEEHGITAPPKVMWGVHDEIRALGKAVAAAVDADEAVVAAGEGVRFADAVLDMVYKEANILVPMALQTLTEDEWARVVPSEGVGAEGPEIRPGAGPDDRSGADAIPLTTGFLTTEQLDLMLRALPLDVTYVDEEDRVRFYSEGDRIFPRSPGVIGRDVRDCHPPKSLDVVQRILDELRAGTKDVAEFWIELGGRFVHIRYFAVRDAAGAYRGVVELTQDVTGIRALTGERRLLDW